MLVFAIICPLLVTFLVLPSNEVHKEYSELHKYFDLSYIVICKARSPPFFIYI